MKIHSPNDIVFVRIIERIELVVREVWDWISLAKNDV